jgi:hypothetical protein
MKVEPLTIRQKLAEHPVGELRDYQAVPASMEFSNLVITLPEPSAGPFYQWFDDFVLKGNAGDDRERPGFLELLSSDMRTVLLRVNFIHLGIFSFAPLSVDRRGRTPRKCQSRNVLRTDVDHSRSRAADAGITAVPTSAAVAGYTGKDSSFRRSETVAPLRGRRETLDAIWEAPSTAHQVDRQAAPTLVLGPACAVSSYALSCGRR